MDRYAGARTSYGTETFEKISNSKILVIGAGGIGCELLKNLVMFGFKSIDIVDLDTIDVSNLNRQFLFRPCNVGQSKALVAADIAKKFNSDVSIKPYHGNIKDSKFGVSFFKKFDLVLNALDNVDARRHVNRLCLAAERPLLDSGTTGYLGQVMPIIKHRTACYECQPKPTQKVYPICTIRSTPDKPVHCIVWAKELFKLLFNKPSESMLHEDDNKDGKESVDVSTYMHVVDLKNYGKNETCNDAGALSWFDVVLNHIEQMLIGVFTLDIEKRISMDIYKTAKKTPVPISQSIIKDAIKKCSLLINAVINFDAKCVIELLHATVMNFESLTGLLARKQLNIDPKCKCTIDAEWDSTVLPIDDVLVEVILLLFLVAAVNMPDTHQIAINQASLAQYKSFYQLGLMEFDKDDAYAMRFVSLCSNLRMNIFHISCINYHDCKGIAGNIIPAIPATNAIVAGIQVMQAINILKDGVDTAVCPLTYCIRNCTRKGVFIQPTVADFPSSSCYVCNSSQIKLEVTIILPVYCSLYVIPVAMDVLILIIIENRLIRLKLHCKILLLMC